MTKKTMTYTWFYSAVEALCSYYIKKTVLSKLIKRCFGRPEETNGAPGRQVADLPPLSVKYAFFRLGQYLW